MSAGDAEEDAAEVCPCAGCTDFPLALFMGRFWAIFACLLQCWMPPTLNFFSDRGGVLHERPFSRYGQTSGEDSEVEDEEPPPCAGRFRIFGAPPGRQVVSQMVGGAQETLSSS